MKLAPRGAAKGTIAAGGAIAASRPSSQGLTPVGYCTATASAAERRGQ
jgi:hypothetical protein